jgi:tetratricopeptide (TPR) repeat protein
MMSHFDSAIDYLTKLLVQQSVQQLQLNNIELATIHNDLAYAYRESSPHSKALEHYTIALDLKRNRVPLDEIDLATTYSDMGWLWMNMNELEKARNFHQEALTIRRRDFINNRSDTAMSLNCLGLVHAYMSELDLAKNCLKEALDIRQSCLPSQHPYIAMSYSSLGSYFELIGNDTEALKMHEQALSIYKSSLPPTHQILKGSYHDVGKLCLKQEQWQKAIDHLKAVLTCDHKHSDDAQAILLSELGQAYSRLRNYQRALDSYQEALIIAKNAKNNTLISELMKMIELVKTKS